MSDYPGLPDYITNPNSTYDFMYDSDLSIDMRKAIHGWGREGFTSDDSGNVIYRQARDIKGRFARSLFSGGLETTALFQIRHTIIEALLQNYHEMMIGESGQSNTGSLIKSIQDATLTSEDQLEGFLLTLNLADIERRRSSGASISTLVYSKYIFKGRRAISSDNMMVFPRYPRTSNANRWVRTKYVRGVEPKDITIMTDTQRNAVAFDISPSLVTKFNFGSNPSVQQGRF